ncbi:hypothetical protein ACOSQ2_031156 [Xanthoceras sorbifolium]
MMCVEDVSNSTDYESHDACEIGDGIRGGLSGWMKLCETSSLVGHESVKHQLCGVSSTEHFGAIESTKQSMNGLALFELLPTPLNFYLLGWDEVERVETCVI